MHPYERDRRYYELAEKWKDGTITPPEEEEFARWYQDGQDAPVYLPESFATGESEHAKRMLDRLREKTGLHVAAGTRSLRRWLPYAAAILLVATTAIWFAVMDPVTDPAPQIVNAEDIAPGTNRATLTLSDGRIIDLSEAKAGIVVSDGITYRDGSTLLDGQASMPSQTQTLTTPKGGTYRITLPDGSDVWLNAASTISYPAQFAGNERHVEISGEAYFSVAKDVDRPFKVTSNGQTVEVLGTEFNISAYFDDPDTRTTLVAGKVKVTPGGASSHILRPGEQAVKRAATIEVKPVDAAQYASWKSGRFHFKRTPLDDVLKQVSRWYDVEVDYRHGIPKETFSGKISRNVTLMGVLDILKVSAVDIRLSGNKIIVD